MGSKTGNMEPGHEWPESQVEVFRLDIVGNRNHEGF